MSLRDRINQSPLLGVGLASGCVVLAGVLVYATVFRSNSVSKPTKAFYTTDDGQTLFKDDLGKSVPFEKGGQEAVRAYVFTCDGGRTTFVGYLEKDNGVAPAAQVETVPTSPAPVRAASEAEARKAAAQSTVKAVVGRGFVSLIKRPGERDWIRPGSREYFQIMSPRCQSSDQILDKVNP